MAAAASPRRAQPRLRSRPAARRLGLGDGAPGRIRPERARARGWPHGRADASSSPAPAAERCSRFVCRPRCAVSGSGPCASECCWSSRSDGRRRKARSSSLRAKLAAPRGPEDGFDERGWLARRGVHVVLRSGDWRMVGRRGGLGGVADGLRAHVARAIAPGLAGERRALLAGVVLGEDEGLSEELRANFKASGLYHLLAVSGQNVVVLAGAVLGLAWLLGIPRLAAQVAVLVAIAAYVLAVGWQPSVVRAGVAGALASLAWLVSRPRDRWHFLAVGAAVLLAWTPTSLLEPGFQLSFAAVAAIFVRRAADAAVAGGLSGSGRGSRRARGLDRLWLRDGADPLAAVRQRPGLLAAGERARDLRDRAVARACPRRRARRAIAPVRRSGPRVAERLARRVRRDLCAVRRAATARAGGLRDGGVRSARSAARSAAARPAAGLAAESGICVLRCARAGAARLAALAGEASASSDRPPHHRARRRSGRLDSRAGSGGCHPRRPGPAGGARGPAAPKPRRHTARRSRPHASAARSHRRRRRGACADPRRARARPEAARLRARTRTAPSGWPCVGPFQWSRSEPVMAGRSDACTSGRSGRTGRAYAETIRTITPSCCLRATAP